MRHILKGTPLTAIMAIVSACSDGGISSPDHSHHAKGEARVQNPSHSSSHETQPKTDKIETHHSDKAKGAETRFAESHAHGDASLAIVLDKSTITVEFDTPLYNLLGFEHTAETAEQKEAVAKAETVLTKGASLFVFNNAAKCSILNETKSIDFDLGDRKSEEEVDNHEDDHHDGGHDDEDHDDEDHDDDDHDDEDHDDETHKDIILQYEFKCESPKALKNVTVKLFEHFQNLTELDLVYLGPNTQKQTELSATKPRMDLTR